MGKIELKIDNLPIKCWKCKEIATYYIETRTQIYKKPHHHDLADYIDIKITSHESCEKHAKKENWKVYNQSYIPYKKEMRN